MSALGALVLLGGTVMVTLSPGAGAAGGTTVYSLTNFTGTGHTITGNLQGTKSHTTTTGAMAKCGTGSSSNCTQYPNKDAAWLTPHKLAAIKGNATKDFFFTVVAPGTKNTPNDGGTANLSWNATYHTGGTWTQREFHITSTGLKWKPVATTIHAYDTTDMELQLAPYQTTPNNGGEYQIAVCPVPASPTSGTGAPGVTSGTCVKSKNFKTTTKATSKVTTSINSPSTTKLGHEWSDKATVSGNSTGGTPTGTVTFYLCKVSTSTGQTGTCPTTTANKLGTVGLSGGSATSPTVLPKSVGSYCFSATYSGSTTYSKSADNTTTTTVATDECFSVAKAPTSTTTTATITGSGTLGSGGTLSDKATVTGNSTGGVPAGTISFHVCGPLGSDAYCTSGTAVGTKSSTAGPNGDTRVFTSTAFTPKAAGIYCFSTVFTPSTSNYASSTDNTGATGKGAIQKAECVKITPAGTTTSTTATITSAKATLGASGTLKDTVTVTGKSGSPAPTGSVEFYECFTATATAPFVCPTTSSNKLGTPVTLTAGTGTPPFSKGSVTAPAPTLAGMYCFGAVFTPSSTTTNYKSSNDNTTGKGVSLECVTIAKATTSTTTTASVNGTVTLGTAGTLADSVTVTGVSGSPAPTGSVQFYECFTATATSAFACSATSSNKLGNPVTLTAGTGTPPFSKGSVNAPAPTLAGMYCFGAVFTPSTTTTNYKSSNDNTTGKGVALECVTIARATTTTTTKASVNGTVTLGAGGTLTDSVTVTGVSGSPAPTGSVQFYECFTATATSAFACSTASTHTLGTPVRLTQRTTATATASGTSTPVTPTKAGMYCFSAVFTPSSTTANYNSSSDNTSGKGVALECVTIAKATTTTTTHASTTTGKTSLGSSGTLTDSVTVTGVSGSTAPRGSVQFYECFTATATSAFACSTTSSDKLGTSVTLSAGSGTPPVSSGNVKAAVPTVAGMYCFSAVFTPSATTTNYTSSSDNTSGKGVGLECVAIGRTDTTTTTHASTTGSVTLGVTGTLTDSVTVTGVDGSPAPTGSVQFYECFTAAATSAFACSTTSSNKLGTPVTLTAGSGTPPVSSGIVTAPAPTLAGMYCFGAVFTPSSTTTNYQSSRDNTSGKGVNSECVLVARAATTTTTTASVNGTVTLGAAGTLMDSVTVTGVGGAPAPTGSVQFYECFTATATSAFTCSTTSSNTLGTPVTLTAGSGTPPVSSGTVTAPAPTLAGMYCFSAVFTPSSTTTNYKSSSDNVEGDGVSSECVAITRAGTTTTTTASTTKGSVTLGKSGTLSDSVSVTGVDGSPAPTGSVQFYECFTATSTSAFACSTTASNKVGAAVTLTAQSGTPPSSTGKVTAPAPTAVGTYCFSAVFTPSATTTNYTSSSDNTSGDGVASECVTIIGPATFTVLKTDVPGTGVAVTPGSTITYTVKVTNTGASAGTATVTDPLPSNVTATTSKPPVCGQVTAPDTCTAKATGTTVQITVSLAPQHSVTVTFSVTVNSTDKTSVTNTATITTVTGHTCTGDACSSSVTNPVVVLNVVKSSTPKSGSTVTRTEKVTYILTLTDSGTAMATDVTVTDTVPAGTTYVAGSASCGPDTTCTVSEVSTKIMWTGISVAAGGSLQITFQVTVNKTDVNGQKITNFALFTNEGTPNCPMATRTCRTNTVTLVVFVRTSAKKTGHKTPPKPPTRISQATTVHTGEPWAGSLWAEMIVLGLGLGLMTIGEGWRRRRRIGQAS